MTGTLFHSWDSGGGGGGGVDGREKYSVTLGFATGDRPFFQTP